MSDRELDALVAEKVMGWTRVSPSLEEGASPKYSVRRRYPHYSTSIADAWLVVDHLYEDGYAYEIYHEPPAKPSVDIWHGFHEPLGGIYADTVPRAICLAALKALGVEVPA